MVEAGTVYLVGAGPGDPGLITLRGLECLRAADLVLYDGLANPLLLRHTKAEAVKTCRSRASDGNRLPQPEVNARLIAAASEGQVVVRLKGGDPFVFGRGGEEAAALSEAGIPFEIVPGITAATAVAAYAGIPLTHRQDASAVAFVTGHEDPAKPDSAVDYEVLARFPGTLVFYMGLHRVEAIVSSLLEHGKPAETPACVVSRGTLPAQRSVSTTLEQLPEAVRAAGLEPPSLIVLGECVRQRDTVSWFERRPLFGKRIGIARPEPQAEATIARCLELGGEPVVMPTIAILPPEGYGEIDATLARLGEFDWLVFTSANGVQGLLGRLWETGGDVRRLSGCRVATIGPGTAEALEGFRLRADLVPETYRAEALAEALVPHVGGKRVLWARASRGRDVLPDELARAGAELTQLVVYRNEDVASFPGDVVERLEAGEVDWIALSSPSIARSLKQLLPDSVLDQVGNAMRLASISPVTTAAAEEAGLPISAEATVHTWDGLFGAIAAAES